MVAHNNTTTGAVSAKLHESEGGAVAVIRPLSPRVCGNAAQDVNRIQGTLRDLIYRAKNACGHFVKKHTTSKPTGLKPQKIQLFGRQILEVETLS